MFAQLTTSRNKRKIILDALSAHLCARSRHFARAPSKYQTAYGIVVGMLDASQKPWFLRLHEQVDGGRQRLSRTREGCSCYVPYRLMSMGARRPPPDPDTELIAHALRLQLSYLSKDQALAVADTILRTFKAARLSIRRCR
jgi:hypothetical protein